MGRKKGRKNKQITIKDPETLAVFGTILIVLSVLLLLSMFFEGNLFSLFRRELGYGVIVMAVVGFAVGFRLVGMRNKYNTVRVIVCLILFFISFLGWVHLFVPADQAEMIAEQGKNGGYIGLAISDLFLNIFGVAGAIGVLTPIMVISLAASFYVSPKELCEMGVKVLSAVWAGLVWISKGVSTVASSRNDDVEIKMDDGKKKDDKKSVIPEIGDGKKQPNFVTEILSQDLEELMEEKVDKANVVTGNAQVNTNGTATIASPQVAALKPHDSTTEQIKKYPNWKLPGLDLLDLPKKLNFDATASITKYANAIEKTLETFGINGCKIKGYSHGPSVTRYNLDLAPGIKFSKIEGLSRDLALALAAPSDLRISPIPNTSFIGIEVPNEKVEPVSMREVFEGEDMTKYILPLSLGKDISGKAIMRDLATMPHMLIAGATGSGKSYLENACILTLLFRYSPDDLKLIMIDPKMVEMTGYNGIPHLLTPPVTDMDKAVNVLKWALVEMNNRYKMFTEKKVRDIKSYNAAMGYQALPYIVIVIDEMADLIITHGANVQGPIIRLAQLARAAGMHLMLATQRPSVDVITGLMKANIPARIGLRVSSAVDSRVILDAAGAETLLGRGDMLVKTTDKFGLARVQGPFYADSEFDRILDFIKEQAGVVEYDDSITESQDNESNAAVATGRSSDDLFDKCVEIVINAQKASASLLQTKLNIGYNRAARLIQEMEDKGIITAADGSKPRKVLVSEWAVGGGDIEE